jgi:acyl-CoA synthetase (AMP-forming)/AMP-acid ligase II
MMMQRPNLGSTAAYIAWHARHFPEATAIVEDGSPVSYLSMAMDLVRCVRAIEALGVRPDRFAGVEAPGRYVHLLLLLACEVIGAATIQLTPGQHDEMTRYCDIVLASSAWETEGPARMVAIPPNWLATLAASPVHTTDLSLLERDVVPGRMVRIVRTSGTSGMRKAMVMPFATQQRRIMGGIADLPRNLPSRPRFLCLYGLATGAVLRRVLTILQLGGSVMFGVGEDACDLIAAGAVHYAIFAVGDLERMVQHATPPPIGHPLVIIAFGTTVTPRLRQQIRERLHATIENAYSSNETNRIAIMDDNNIGTLCAGVEVRIVNDTGHDVPPGAAGIIRVRNETMVDGYFNDEALTKVSFIDGWFQTSDIGFMPEPGKLVVLGRADDMLNIGGVKVAPSPIEAELKSVDGISDVVVMSVASENGVGILLAAIEISGDRLLEGTAQRTGAILSRYLGAFVIMPSYSFPRTASGKIRRHEIEAEYRRRPAHSLIAVT